MKTSGIFAAVILGALALSVAVWIGRYNADPVVLVPQTGTPKPVDPGPPISESGLFPKAVVGETEHDFGVMTLHQKGSHKFTIKNEGKGELKLVARREDATCQCTLGELADGDTIPPGESRDVTLAWEIKVKVESFRHTAKIRTNDPENRVIEYVVKGKVDERYKLMPGELMEVGNLSRTDSAKASGVVCSAVVDNFAIKSATCAHDKVRVTHTPMSVEALAEHRAKSGYVVNVEVLPGVAVGPFTESVVIAIDDAEQPDLVFRLQGHMSGPIEFLGPSFRKETSILTFGEFKAVDGKEITLSLFVRDFDEDLQLLGVEPTPDRIQFELKKAEQLTGKTRRYQLKAKVLPGEPLDFYQGESLKLNLKFNHPDSQNVTLNIRLLAT